MAVRVKFGEDGKGVDPASGGNYSGPNLPKGSYRCKLKRMTLGEINSMGANKGKPRITVLLEVVGPPEASQYFGHPVWDGLNIIKPSIPFVNAFLHGLTDGSESAKRAVEKSFWDDGPLVTKVKNKKGEVQKHITKIGKYKIGSPNGEIEVQVTAAPDEYQGKFKAKVTNYIPIEGSNNAADDDDEDDDLLDDVDDGADDDDDDDDGDDDDYEMDDDADDDDDDDDDDDAVESGGKRKPF